VPEELATWPPVPSEKQFVFNWQLDSLDRHPPRARFLSLIKAANAFSKFAQKREVTFVTVAFHQIIFEKLRRSDRVAQSLFKSLMLRAIHSQTRIPLIAYFFPYHRRQQRPVTGQSLSRAACNFKATLSDESISSLASKNKEEEKRNSRPEVPELLGLLSSRVSLSLSLLFSFFSSQGATAAARRLGSMRAQMRLCLMKFGPSCTCHFRGISDQRPLHRLEHPSRNWRESRSQEPARLIRRRLLRVFSLLEFEACR
jgi:hypothetical protein